jgi:hypothetical protein
MRVVPSRILETNLSGVIAEGEKGGENGYCGCGRCTCAAHDYGKNVDFGTHLVLSNSIGEEVHLSRISCAVREKLWYVRYFHSTI